MNEAEMTQYDKQAKYYLSIKDVTATFFKNLVPELKALSIQEIADNISEDGSYSIKGLNTEESSEERSTIIFDLLFAVPIPSEPSKVLMDLEMQRNIVGREVLYNRGVYYVSRLISMQKNLYFSHDDYIG